MGKHAAEDGNAWGCRRYRDHSVAAVGELAGLAYIQVGALFDLIFAPFFSRQRQA